MYSSSVVALPGKLNSPPASCTLSNRTHPLSKLTNDDSPTALLACPYLALGSHCSPDSDTMNLNAALVVSSAPWLLKSCFKYSETTSTAFKVIEPGKYSTGPGLAAEQIKKRCVEYL